MKKIYFACAALAATALLPACSADETRTDHSPTDNAIRFAATTEYASRAGDITTNNLTAFNVWAYTGTATSPNVFMQDVSVSKTGTNTWTYSPLKYWPADENVDFYAYAPASWVGNTGPLAEVPYTTGVPADQDLVYAVAANLQGQMANPSAQVVFNFRHALSKVTVKMSSSNSTLKVDVSNVVMANIAHSGNFHFPANTTTGTATADNTGYWTDQNTPAVVYLHLSSSTDDYLTLSTTPQTINSLATNGVTSNYLIPQKLTWSNPVNADTDTYLTVMCSVYDAASGEKLWPNANTPADNLVDGHLTGDGLLKFPLSTSSITSWEPGYNYIYNLVINANDEMSPIQFGTPTVDTYVEVTTNYQ